MLFVNKKYESLNKILCSRVDESDNVDEAYTIGAGFGEEQALEYILALKSLDEDGVTNVTNFVHYLYSKYSDNDNPLKVPFRFDPKDKTVKISAAYKSYLIASELAKYNATIIDGNSFYLGLVLKNNTRKAIKFEIGEGSLSGASRDSKGTKYEETIASEIRTLISTVASSGKMKLSKEKLETILDSSIHHLIPIYMSGDLDDAISKVRNNPDLDLEQLVECTGRTTTSGDRANTHRNDHGEIIRKSDFGASEFSVEDVLKASGKIISDVTIHAKPKSNDSGPEVYISVKMAAAQLSNINAINVFERNSAFCDGIRDGQPYKTTSARAGKNAAAMKGISGDPKMVAYNNFCDAFGIDREDLYNKYLSISKGEDFDRNIKGTGYDEHFIGAVTQKLIGGNYWYVNPSKAMFISSKDLGWKFSITERYITASGRRINIKGNVDGVPATFAFRTKDKKYTYPYALFIETSVSALLNKCIIKD